MATKPNSTPDMEDDTVTLSAQTYRVLNHVPFAWTDEPTVRTTAQTETGIAATGIAQRLVSLERKGLIARRWFGFVRQIRRVQLEPLS